MTDFLRAPTWLQRFAVSFAAGLTLLGFTLVNFLNHVDYPLLRLELGYLYGGVLLLAGAMAALYSGQRRWGRAVLEALLVAAFIDLNMNLPWLAGASFLAVFGVVMQTGRSLLPFVSVMAAVMLTLNLMGFVDKHPWIRTHISSVHADRAEGEAGKPAILHLILDEHAGFEGFPQRDASSSKMKADLRNFYGSRNFAMFGRAYSEHYYTANSIPQIFNLGGPAPRQESPRTHGSAGQTRYLMELSKRGYALRLYQNEYLDLCKGAAAAACTTYDYNSMRPILGTSLSASDRAQLILFKLLGLSDVLQAINSRSGSLLKALSSPKPATNPPLELLLLTNPIASFAVMDRLAVDLRHAKPGEAYIAHLLVPHVPSSVDENCRVLPLKDWDRRITWTSKHDREAAYYDQIRCTMKKTDQLLKSLSSSPAGESAVVIIHGDHGSRIWSRTPDERHYPNYRAADLVYGFSTLFAVRSPQIGRNYVEAPASVADLLSDLTDSHFTSLPKPTPAPPIVYLADADWQPWKRVVLPESWWKHSPSAQRRSAQQTESAARRDRNTLKKDPS